MSASEGNVWRLGCWHVVETQERCVNAVFLARDLIETVWPGSNGRMAVGEEQCVVYMH